jgi:hypothetical protein
MKTAMQELMELLIKKENRHKGNDLGLAYGYASELAEGFIEIEKQQIIDAYGQGFDDGVGGEHTWKFLGSEDYYNETFKP